MRAFSHCVLQTHVARVTYCIQVMLVRPRGTAQHQQLVGSLALRLLLAGTLLLRLKAGDLRKLFITQAKPGVSGPQMNP